MRIAQVPRRFTAAEWGGTEAVVLETSKRLRAMGHDARIVCPDALAKGDPPVMEGVPVTRVPYFYPYIGLKKETRRALDKKGGNLFSFALIKTLLEVRGLDVIHLHTQKRCGGIGRYAALKRRIPYVVTLHGGLFDVPGDEALSLTEPARGTIEWGKILGWWVGSRRVLHDAAAIICVGEGERRAVKERFPEKRVVLLPNGVDPDRFAQGDGPSFRKKYGIPAEALVLLTVGRIDGQKNQIFLVRALPRLLEIEPGAHLLFVGPVTNAAYLEKVRAEAARLGLSGRVTIVPGLAPGSGDLAAAYHGADLFVLPSIHEPFGIVILEAWSAGLPVLAARTGGVRSLVCEGRPAGSGRRAGTRRSPAAAAAGRARTSSRRSGAAGRRREGVSTRNSAAGAVRAPADAATAAAAVRAPADAATADAAVEAPPPGDALLFDPGDEAGFLRLFREALRDPHRSRAMAEAGRAKARAKYHWDGITRRLAKIYEVVVDENPLRP